MRKLFKLNAGTILALFIAFYVVYYLLLQDTFLHTSISSIIASSHRMDLKQHLLVLGLLPIYIAAMIFGAGLLGIYYLGPTLQQFLVRNMKCK